VVALQASLKTYLAVDQAEDRVQVELNKLTILKVEAIIITQAADLVQVEHNKLIILKVDLLQLQEIIIINKPIILKVEVETIILRQDLVTIMETNKPIIIKAGEIIIIQVEDLDQVEVLLASLKTYLAEDQVQVELNRLTILKVAEAIIILQQVLVETNKQVYLKVIILNKDLVTIKAEEIIQLTYHHRMFKLHPLLSIQMDRSRLENQI
jgi:hypothetical protein